MAVQLNEQQQMAVEHNGGVLLNAGAGSGKTRVIIEHLSYLVETKYQQLLNSKVIDIEMELRSYLSKIVVMTFTKEAAGELQARLYNRFSEIEDAKKKVVINDALESLGVSTIHSFCLKLINRGYIFGAPASLDIVDRFKIDLKIEDLTKQWFERNLENPKVEIFLKNIHAISDSMKFVFASPELRYDWSVLDVENVEFNEQEYFENIFKLLGIDLFDNDFNCSSYSEDSKKSWYPKLEKLSPYFSCVNYTWDNIQEFNDLVISLKLRKHKTQPDAVKEIHEQCSTFKKFIDKHQDNYNAFFSNKEVYREWLSLYKELYDFISQYYYLYQGIDFSDIEFLTLKSLSENEESRRLCQQNFNYVIVDEYQDTSPGQFEIIKHVIGNDFQKLMCVGDRKQAIYGFRGGEIAVFNATEKVISKSLFMSNNYRSEQAVVNFNNMFFERLFVLGEKYQGEDKFKVAVDYQDFPEDIKEAGKGRVVRNVISLELDVDKVDVFTMNGVEARAICDYVKNDTTDKGICVLYRSLAPSKILISNLMKDEIPFIAQVKIPYGEDPLIVIFRSFINFLIESGKEGVDEKRLKDISRYYNFILQGVCAHYKVENISLTTHDLLDSLDNYKNSNLEYAFWSLIFSLGLSSSAYKNNNQKIVDIISGAKGDIDDVYKILKSLEQDSYSTNFSYLTDAKVRIMTTHASKGLEFDTIILGGIHTNGRSVPDRNNFGALPGAMSWSKYINDRKQYSSPMLILEKLIKKQKEFSETKRLFYVACTRAETNIEYFDISINGDEVKFSENSWVHALRLHGEGLVESRIVEVEYEKVDNRQPPIYFLDALGIRERENSTKLGMISELSVTKLSELELCSRKFYYNQVLKLEDELKDFANENDISIPKAKGISDADRGNRLHYLIEMLIKNKDYRINNDNEREILEWVNSQIHLSKYDELKSEYQLKFNFFGQMITGIVDAITYKDGQVTEVWDFKSGLINEDKLRTYFFQTMTYVHGLNSIGIPVSKTVKLKILALDSLEVIEREVDLEQIKGTLFKTWSKLSNLVGEKIDHCSSCTYGNICHQ